MRNLLLFAGGTVYTYPNFMELAKIYHIHLLPVRQDAEGMDAAHLELICTQNTIKGVYLMPDCCNPTTVCISAKRRMALVEIIQKYQLTVIEDDIYAGQSSPELPPMYALIPEQTCYLSGTSKAICTGLRVSFLAFGEQFRQRLLHGIYNMNMKTSSLDVEVIAELIFSGDARQLVRKKHELAQEYNRVFDSCLCKAPTGKSSLFRWMRISDGRDGRLIESELYALGVDLCHSYRFCVRGDEQEHFLRISLPSPGSIEQLNRGLQIIKEFLT